MTSTARPSRTMPGQMKFERIYFLCLAVAAKPTRVTRKGKRQRAAPTQEQAR
jgi:hypothetical protein